MYTVRVVYEAYTLSYIIQYIIYKYYVATLLLASILSKISLFARARGAYGLQES